MDIIKKHNEICNILQTRGLRFASTYDFKTVYDIFFKSHLAYFVKHMCLTNCDYCKKIQYKYFTSNLKKAYLTISNYFTSHKEEKCEWTLYRVKNTIHFKGEIPYCINFASKFCRLLNEIEQSSEDKIIIDIDSPGGYVDPALYISHYMDNYIKKEIVGYSYGLCSSAAVLIYLACNVRYMCRFSYCYLHKPFDPETPTLPYKEILFDCLFFVKYYLKKIKKCNVKKIEEFFKGKGRYITPQEALEIGLCHHIIN